MEGSSVMTHPSTGTDARAGHPGANSLHKAACGNEQRDLPVLLQIGSTETLILSPRVADPKRGHPARARAAGVHPDLPGNKLGGPWSGWLLRLRAVPHMDTANVTPETPTHRSP